MGGPAPPGRLFARLFVSCTKDDDDASPPLTLTEGRQAPAHTAGPALRPPLTGDYIMALAIVRLLRDKERETVQTAASQRL